MRWDDLFADLEAQAEALLVAERDAEVAELTRLETSRLELARRLRPRRGQQYGCAAWAARCWPAGSARSAPAGYCWMRTPAGKRFVATAAVSRSPAWGGWRRARLARWTRGWASGARCAGWPGTGRCCGRA